MAESTEKTTPATEIGTTDAASSPSQTQSQTESQTANPAEPFEIPVLALQNTTLFPETVVPLAVGRPRSIAAVEAALAKEEKLLACITVRADVNLTTQDAKAPDLYEVGTLAIIKRMERIERHDAHNRAGHGAD